MSRSRGKADALEGNRFSLLVAISRHSSIRLEGSREVCLEAYRQVRDELRCRIEARFVLDLTPVP